MRYTIWANGKSAGDAEVIKSGLYYKIMCRIVRPKKGMYRLNVRCCEKTVDLGLCVPMQDHFGVDTSVPIRKIGEGELIFELIGEHHSQKFIAISKETPVKHLAEYSKMRFVILEGEKGVILTDHSL